MSRTAKIAGPVTGGVDTHAEMHVAAVVDQVGRVLGAGSYGAGLARHLEHRVPVLEVPRPDRQRRRHGKSDAIDAVSAALAALRGEDHGTPNITVAISLWVPACV